MEFLSYTSFVKQKHAVLIALIYAPIVFSECFDAIGIGGGNSISTDYIGLIGSSGAILNLPNAPDALPEIGSIKSVNMNGSGNSIIGGSTGADTYAALVSSTGAILNLSPLPTNGYIRSVAINNSGASIIGGLTGIAPNEVPYAALVSPSGTISSLPISGDPFPTNGNFASVAINNSSKSIVGGQDSGTGAPYAALISASGDVLSLDLTTTGPINGYVESVAINDSGNSIVGGFNGISPSPAYAALVSSDAVVLTLPTGPSLLPVSGHIYSVAINSLGNSIIGGWDASNPAYAALISPSGAISNLPVGGSALPTAGVIDSVAINDSGAALIGGYFGTPGFYSGSYAALVSASGSVTNLGPLPQQSTFSIKSVAINQFGAGLIGGGNGSNSSYMALVTPSGALVPLNLPSSLVDINSVSLIRALSQIPTQCLKGNNRSFAKYINEEAPDKAFYFLPALFDGSLSDALESAAPTRNALSLFSIDNNLFFLNTGLSAYLREQRHRLPSSHLKRSQPVASLDFSEEYEDLFAEEDFLVDNSEWDFLIANEPSEWEDVEEQEESSLAYRPYTLWGEAIGAWASQKAQHQTPAFDPYVAGGILGIDRGFENNSRAGIAFSYLWTHVHEEENAGFSHVHQELACLYTMAFYKQFYADIAVWGGLFQTDQVRNIQMTGFEFKSSSHPHGTQIAPHIELGYDWRIHKNLAQNLQPIVNPFVMADWVTAWQQSFKEKGSPFNAEQKAINGSFLRLETGLRIYKQIPFQHWILGLEQKGSYVYRNPLTLGTINASLVGSPGSFTVNTLSSRTSLGAVGMTCTFKPVSNRYPYGSLIYQGEFSKAYKSNQLIVETAWDF